MTDNREGKEEIAEKEMEQKHTPLDTWSKETNPAIMSGDQWVDKEDDFGNKSVENEELEEGLMTQSAIFMHPIHDVSYKKD